MDFTLIDTMWVLLCAGLVFLMQAGFLCLETGLTRSKNAINVAIKNMTDFSVSLLLFWAFGFALMFGATYSGWIGTEHFFVGLSQDNSQLATFFLFQAMFCATAATIVSGAVAERMRFAAYVATTIIVSAFIYPVFGHWAWGGAIDGQSGWLANLGFVDFAGSTVVHGIGGWAALAAVLIIGPRTGRFCQQANSAKSLGSNLPLAMLGTLLLWFGWIGFNGGSTLAMNDQVPKIIGNTFLAGAAGMLTALVIGWSRQKNPGVCDAINGSLAGLVAITAGCHAVSTVSALVIGAIGAVVMLAASRVLERFGIDDAVGAFPVHGAAGVWGTIAVALFGSTEILGTGLSLARQLLVQLTGVVVAGVVTFGTCYLLLRLVGRVIRLRVTPEEERIGLNVVEHGVSTEFFDLVTDMQEQYRITNFTTRLNVESGSDVEIVAAQYNRVLDKVNEETNIAIQMAETAELSREQTEQACAELEDTVAELREFKQLSEGRELRMIELKTEVNRLADLLGEPQRYGVDFDYDEQSAAGEEGNRHG